MNKLRKHGVYYDSRIKLLLILLTSALAFALGGGLTGLLLFGVVCLFALLSGLWKTSIGQETAKKIYERHCFFTEQLIAAGIDPKTAEADACRIEHNISDESFSRLKETATQKQD